jgi:hypothetical protein
MIPHMVSFEVGISRNMMCEAEKCYELLFSTSISFFTLSLVFRIVFSMFADLILSSAFH